MPDKRSVLISCIFLILSLSDLFPQAATINGWRHPDLVYCSTEGGDSLVGASPSGKPFYFDGVPYTASPVLVITTPGKAIFYPDRTTVGTHTIKYGSIGSNEVIMVVTIQAPVAATLSAFANVCSTTPPFSLFNSDSSNVSPKNGRFSGPGVNASGTFNPAVAGPGVHTITYTAGIGSCNSAVNRPITVVAAPATGINPFTPVCEGTPPIILSQGFPAGGTYSGPGVDVAGRFDQSATGIGSFPITYTYSNGTCTNSSTRNILVAPNPSASFSGLSNLYCTDDAGVNLLGNPAGVTGSFSGPGITDNGNGTALFEPVMAGLGTHPVRYIYTSPDGCSDTAFQQVQIGTNVVLNGLGAQYCINSGNITVSASPVGGSYSVTAGLTDNGDGTAVFSPSIAGAGMHTVSYTFTDANGCINTRSVTVRVYALPVPSIINLAASYCANSLPATIRGNFQPSGNFNGPGVTDNGNGTALFNPNVLLAGNSYPVSYNYSDPATGCSASVTNNVLINPVPSGNISGNADICYGTAANLKISLAGTAPFSITLTDGTGSYSYNNVAGPLLNQQVFPSDTALYRITDITDSRGCKSAGNGSALIRVKPEVFLISQPASQKVCPGNDIAFSVTASGVNLNYQWEKDGAPIAGATNVSLVLNDVQPADIGIYRCMISGDCGIPVTSNEASLQLWSPVVLAMDPVDEYECEGAVTILQAQATGSNLSWQWYRNNVVLIEGAGFSGTTSADLTLGPLLSTMAGNYHVRVTGTCGAVNSNTAIVRIDKAISVTSHPGDATVCEGVNAVFRIIVTGDNLSYQWQLNGADLPGETSDVLTIAGTNISDEGFYRCIIRNGCGSEVTSNAAQLSVRRMPAITSNPLSLNLCESDNAVFRITATGTALSYQWKRDGVLLSDNGRITGSTGSILTIADVAGQDAGNYSCTVFNNCDSLVSATASLVVDTSLSILTQPQSIHECLNRNVIFSIAAAGNNISYQWLRNGVPMPGQNNPVLVINNITPSDAASYYCTVSNSCGKSVNSLVANLTIDNSVILTEEPADISLCAGETAVFKAKASGAGLSYKWEFNGSALSDGGSISGTGTETLIIGSAENMHEGVYNCLVQGLCGTERSIPASLIVNDTLSIVLQPSNIVVCEGNTAQFRITATGSVGYQWQKDETDIPGATGESLVIANAGAADSGVYRCLVYSLCDTLPSDGGFLSIKKIPVISLEPLPVNVCEDQRVQFKANADGSELSWQWMMDGTPVNDGNGIQGSASSTLIIDSAKISHSGIYSAVVSGYCKSIETAPAMLSVTEAPQIIQQPIPDTTCEGQTTSFQVAVSGNVTYQWQKDIADLPGETNETLVLTNISDTDAGIYRCRVTGICSDFFSEGALLTVNRKPQITDEPDDITLCEGNLITLRTGATGNNITYRWKHDGAYISDDASISGSTGPVLSILNATTAHEGIYQCEVVSTCNVVTSHAATVMINENIDVISQPATLIRCQGQAAAFSIMAVGNDLTYQWQKNGADIPGATESQYVIAIVSSADSGTYQCIISNPCGSVSSIAASLTVDLPPVIQVQPLPEVHICNGNTLSGGITAVGTSLNYQWYRNGSALVNDGTVTGADGRFIAIDPVSPIHEGIYYCEVFNACSTTASNGLQVWIDEAAQITEQPKNIQVCTGGDIIVALTATGDILNYQWQKNGSDIPGGTMPVYTVNNAAITDSGSYQCVITSVCGQIISDAVQVKVHESPVITANPPALISACEGTDVLIDVTVSGAAVSWQWKKNGAGLVNGGNISGAQSPHLRIANISATDDAVYTCEITGNCSQVTSAVCRVNVLLTPAIVFEAEDYFVLNGGNASFSTTLSGNISTWQWYFNNAILPDGGAISGANTSTVNITGVTPAHEGIYNITATGACGTATSQPASLTILAESVITMQPAGDTKCEGESMTFNVETTGAGHAYQWKKNGSPLSDNARISGSLQATLTISGLLASDAGSYSCIIDGTENSAPALLFVNRTTSINYVAGENKTCTGETITLLAESIGDSLNYQWYRNGTSLNDDMNISGSSTGIMVIQPADPAYSGSYTCLISGACGSRTTDPVPVTISDPAVLITHPKDTTVCEAQPVTLSTVATGDGLSWQWYKNGQAIHDSPGVSGTKSAVLIIASAGSSNEGVYYCIIEGACNRVFSNSARIAVNKNTNITGQPVNTDRCPGDMAVLSTISGIPGVSYQWQKDGSNLLDDARISGSETGTLRIINLQTADNGNYQCIITGICNSVSGNPVKLTVPEQTTIVSNPAGGSICEGNSFSFSINTTGSSLGYQWIKDGIVLSDNDTYSGTQTEMLVIDSALIGNSGTYYCRISGTCGVLESDYAVLTVNQNTSVTANVAISRICEGADFQLTVSAKGSSVNLQWQKDGAALADGIHYSGTNGTDLHILNASLAESGIYTCEVTGGCGVSVSAASEVIVSEPPVITVQPVDTALCEGDNLLLNLAAVGDNPEFQWKFNGTPLTDSTNQLFIEDISLSNSGIYTCLVSNICGWVNSDPAVIQVTGPAVLLSSPSNLSVCSGQQAGFKVSAAGSNLVYRWEFNGAPLSDGLRITGSNTKSMVISNTGIADQGAYRCVISDACGNIVNSDAASLTVSEPVAILNIPAGDTLCEGQPVNLQIDASGSNLAFRWFRNGVLLSDSPALQGTQTATLNIPKAGTASTGYYTCVISGTCGSAVTSPISLQIIRTVTIMQQPVNLAKCAGENAVFNVTATGDSLKYQWMKNGLPVSDGAGISGSSSSLLLLTGLTDSETGSYHCVISNSCVTLNSQPAALTVTNFPAAAGAIIGQTVVCQGETGLIYSVPAISGAENYRWTLPPGMVIVSGQNTRQITVDFNLHESGGPVYVNGMNSCGAGLSSPVLNVVVNPLPVAYAGENTGICSVETTLSAFDPGLPATGSWQVISGPALISQPAQAVTTVTGLRNGENRFLWTIQNNGCSNSDTVIIYNNKLNVEAGNDTSICSHIYQLNAEMPLQGTGKWSIVSGAGYNIDRYNPNSMVSGLAKGLNLFKWSAVNNGCASYDTVKITNNLPTDADAGNDQLLHSDNTTLSGNIPQTGTGEWTLLNGSATLANPLKNNTQVTGLGQGQNIFAWTITHMGCVSEDTVIITNSITDSTEAGPNQVVCSNTVRLSAKNPYPGFGEWSVKRGAASFAKNSDYNTYAYNLMQGENVLVWTQHLNGITEDSVVIVNNLPTTANAGVSVSVCFDSVNLNANMPYIGAGEWTIVSGSGNFANRNSNITSVSNLARGRNDFKWTITNAGCTSSSVVTINNNRPTDAQAGFDVITCEDSLVLNPNVPTFGTGEWSVYSGSARFNGNTAYDLGSNNNYLIYSIRRFGCYSRDTVIITSHKPTEARLGTDLSICLDSVSLTANVPVIGTGIWSLQSGSAEISDIHMASAFARNIGQGSNTFRWTIDYLGCSSYDDLIISNDYIEANAGADQTGCNDRIILQANDPGYSSGIWTIIGGSTGASILDPHSPNTAVENLAAGPNLLRWTISKNACESFDEITLINNRPTTAFAGENAFLCTDEMKLRATPVTIGDGTWSILSGSGSISDDHDPLATVRGLAPGINILRWTTLNSGCISTDEVIINNNKPVNVYAGLDQTLCADSTLLYANPPVIGKGSWSILYGKALFDQPGSYNTQITGLGNGMNRLMWTVSTTGCADADTVEITNNLPTKAIAGSDFPVCNSIGNLSANVPLYGTGRWSMISGAGIITDPASAHTVAENLALGSNTLQWTITNVNCVSEDQLTIINNSPTVADAGESAEVCGETAILYANYPMTGTGYWSVTSGTGVADDPQNFNTTVRGLNFGENTLRWTTQNGECYTFDEITVTNNLADVYAGEDQVVYEPTVILTGNNPGSGAGLWNLVAGQGNITAADNFTSQVTNLGAGLNTFEWTITNGSCTARDQALIHFKIMPMAGFMINESEGCPGLTVDFINTTRYGTTYRWDMGDGTNTIEVNPSHTYNWAGSYPVRLTAFGPDNRNVTCDTIITIHSKPVADFQFAPDTAVINDPVRFYNGSFAGASEYLWNFNDNEYSTDENPVHYYKNSGNFEVTLVVNSGFGCSDTIIKTLTVAEDGVIIFPNAFTPDPGGPGDGTYNDNDFSNDVFHPYFENITEYHLEVYSRWGVLLFETDDLHVGWDGYYKGELLARDVYVWKATGKYVSGRQFLKTGNVLLISNE